MKILLVGTLDVYMCAYLKCLASRQRATVDLLTISIENLPSDHVRETIYVPSRPTGLSPLDYPLRLVLSFWVSIKLLLRGYDVIHIQYVTPYNIYFLPLFALARHTVATFWGSDLASVPLSGHHRLMQKAILRFVKRVHVQTREYETLYRKHFGPKLPVTIARFGMPVDFSKIDEIREESLQAFAAQHGFSLGRLKVVCGFYAKPEKRHFYMIDELASLPDGILEELCILFPLSYGDQAYAQEVEEYAREHLPKHCDSVFFREFMSIEEIAVLRRASDIVINVSDHDCMSATMLESLYAGALMVNGSWLPYDILDELGVFSMTIPDTKAGSLTRAMADGIAAFAETAGERQENAAIVREHFTWESTIDNWIALYND